MTIKLKFTHLPTNQSVEFTAWITNYSDNYVSNWNSETLFGRMDPMMTFQNTQRTISVEWETVAASKEEAITNMRLAQKFIQLLYPVYDDGTGGAAMIASPPLMRVEFENLITSNRTGGRGLICALGGTSYNPVFDEGVFHEGTQIFPQTVTFSSELTVLHEHLTGWTVNNNTFGTGKEPSGAPGKVDEKGVAEPQMNEVSAPNFPYGVDQGTKPSRSTKGSPPYPNADVNPEAFSAPSAASQQEKRADEEIFGTQTGESDKVEGIVDAGDQSRGDTLTRSQGPSEPPAQLGDEDIDW